MFIISDINKLELKANSDLKDLNEKINFGLQELK